MIGRQRFQRRDIQTGSDQLQRLTFGRRAAKARYIRIPRVEQDHPAGTQILVQLGIGRVRGLFPRRQNWPVQEGIERQLVLFDIHANRHHRLDRGALPQLVRQAQKPGARHLVHLWIAGDHIGQHHRRRRLQGARVVGQGPRDLLCAARHRRAGKAKRQNQRRRRAAHHPAQPPGQPKGCQHIDQKQDQGPGQESPLQHLRHPALQRFDRHAGRPFGGQKFGLVADHVQRHPPVGPGIKPRLQGKRRASGDRTRQRLALDPRQFTGIRCPAKGIQHHLRHPDLPGKISRLGLGRLGRNRQPLKHLHEQAR